MLRKHPRRLFQKVTHFIFRLMIGDNNQSFVNHIQQRLTKDQKLFILTLVFFITSTIIPNNKAFFVLCSLFVLFVLWITKSIRMTLFLSFVPLSIFWIGQDYTFLAVPKSITFSPQYPDGRMLSFTFSPYFILLITSIGTTIIAFLSKKLIKSSLSILILLLLILMLIISATNALYFPHFSIIYTMYWLGLTSLLMLSIYSYQQLNPKKRYEMWRLFFTQLSLTLMFISLLSVLQLVKRSPLGLKIEATQVSPLFGAGADESNLIFRPIGLAPHANMMANEVFILLISLFLVFERLRQRRQKEKNLSFILVLAALASCFTIIISQSRSVYLGLALFFTLMIASRYKEFKKIVSLAKKIIYQNKKLWAILLFFALFVLLVVGNRFIYSFYSFTETGGVTIRREISQEALGLIKKYPIWGVGPGMFIPSLAREHPMGIVRQFPESVHNGFLLFTAESGLLSQLIVIVFAFFIIRTVYLIKLSSPLKKTIAIGLVAQLIPMFFQPFINYLTVYTITTLILINET